METLKKSLKSRTIWFGLLTGLVPLFVPQAQAAIAEHTVTFNLIWGTLAVILRLVTKESILLVE